MDLGATLCTPRSPGCVICPVTADCRARGRADIERLPAKPAKKAKPQRHGVAHWNGPDGRVWLIRRPAKGMRGGVGARPAGEWLGTPNAETGVGEWRGAQVEQGRTEAQ